MTTNNENLNSIGDLFVEEFKKNLGYILKGEVPPFPTLDEEPVTDQEEPKVAENSNTLEQSLRILKKVEDKIDSGVYDPKEVNLLLSIHDRYQEISKLVVENQ